MQVVRLTSGPPVRNAAKYLGTLNLPKAMRAAYHRLNFDRVALWRRGPFDPNTKAMRALRRMALVVTADCGSRPS